MTAPGRTLWIAATLAAGLSSAASAQRTALRVGGYVAADGTIAPPATVVIEDGTIQAIHGLEVDVADAVVADYPDAVLCPGLIDTHSSLTVPRNHQETANALEPQAVASALFDRHHRDLERALAGGITTVLLTPPSNNLICGTAVAVSTAAGHGANAGVIGRGPLKLSLAESVFAYEREPTSRVGALSLLRRTLDAARSGNGARAIRAIVNDHQPVLADCPKRMDVETMLGLAGEYGFRLSVLHGDELIDAASILGGSGVTVIVPPGTFASRQRVLAGPAALERAGVPFALAGMMPDHDADAIRISAALAVRYGASPETARKAMTINAARVAGVDELIGSIEPGKRADLVLFSDDPLRLDASVMAVYVNGERVFVRRDE